MAYVVPIHRASSIRNALKLHFMNAEEEALVVALVDPLLLLCLLLILAIVIYVCANWRSVLQL